GASKLVDVQLRALDVAVAVDESRDEVASGNVASPRAIVLSDTHHVTVGDRHIGPKHLTGEDGEHLAAGQDQIRLGIPSRDRDPAPTHPPDCPPWSRP